MQYSNEDGQDEDDEDNEGNQQGEDEDGDDEDGENGNNGANYHKYGMEWTNGIDPFMAFQIEHCDTYEGLWEWDLAMTCGEGERGLSNSDCFCTWTELFIEEGELDCSAIFDCPENCPVCSTCLRVAGCDSHGHLIVNRNKRYAGGIFTMFAIAIILGCQCAKTQRQRKGEHDSLSVQLMDDNDFSDEFSSSCGSPKVWMAPVEFMEGGDDEKDVWLVPDNMSYTTRSEASTAESRGQQQNSDDITHPDTETPSIPSKLRPKTKKTGKLKKSKNLAVGFMSELLRFRFYRPRTSRTKNEASSSDNPNYLSPALENEKDSSANPEHADNATDLNPQIKNAQADGVADDSEKHQTSESSGECKEEEEKEVEGNLNFNAKSSEKKSIKTSAQDESPNPMVHSQLPQQMPHGDDAFINENKPKKGPKKVKQPKKLQMPVSMAFPDLLGNEEAVEKKDAALPSSQAPLDAQCSSEADKEVGKDSDKKEKGDLIISVPSLERKALAGHDDLFAKIIVNTTHFGSAPPLQGLPKVEGPTEDERLSNKIISNEHLFEVSDDDADDDIDTQDTRNNSSSGSGPTVETSSRSGSGPTSSSTTSTSSTSTDAVEGGTTISASSEASSSKTEGTSASDSSINDSCVGSVHLSSPSVSRSSSASSLSESLGGADAVQANDEDDNEVMWIDIDEPRDQNNSSQNPITITESSDGAIWINSESTAPGKLMPTAPTGYADLAGVSAQDYQQRQQQDSLCTQSVQDAESSALIEDSVMDESNVHVEESMMGMSSVDGILEDDISSSASSSNPSKSLDASSDESDSHAAEMSSSGESPPGCTREGGELMSQQSIEDERENNIMPFVATDNEVLDSDSDVYIEENESDNSTANSAEQLSNDEEESKDDSHLISL